MYIAGWFHENDREARQGTFGRKFLVSAIKKVQKQRLKELVDLVLSAFLD